MMEFADDDEAFVSKIERTSPEVVNLARVVSLAVRIEPELLRKARLELLPQTDAGAEADLWFSPLAQSQTPLSMVLLPEAAKVLRRRLAENQDELKRAWEVLKAVHKNASPTVILEEELTWLALSNQEDAVTQIQRRLEEVLVSLANEDRPGLARWAARALPLLPEAARTSQAARVLSVIAGVKTGKPQILADNPSSVALQKWLRLVSPKSPNDVSVGVRLLERVNGGGSGSQRVIEFSNPPASQSHEITAPRTNPFLFEVTWEDQSGQHFEQMSLPPLQTQTYRVGSGPIKIRTALGHTHTLLSGETISEQAGQTQIPSSIPPPPPAFVARTELVQKIKQELSKNHLVALTGEGGIGKTTVAAEVARQMADIYRQRIVWINVAAYVGFGFSTMLDEIAAQLGRADFRRIKPEEKPWAMRALIAQAPSMIVLDGIDLLPNRERVVCLRFLYNQTSYPVIVTTRASVRLGRRVTVPRLSVKEAQGLFVELYKKIPGLSVVDIWPYDDVATLGNPLFTIWRLALLRAADMDAALTFIQKRVTKIFQNVFESQPREEQVVLMALALFVPDASRDAAARVSNLDREELDRVAGELESKRLIRTTADGERLMIEGLTREIIRQEVLGLDARHKPRPMRTNADELSRLFIEYFRLYAKRHEKPGPENFDALEIEKENLLSAVEMAFNLRDDESLLVLIHTLNSNLGEGFLFQRGYWDEALRANQIAMGVARRISIRDYSRVLAQLEIDVAYRVDAKYFEGIFAQHVAYIYHRRGNLPLARRLYGQVIGAAQRYSDLQRFADNLYQLAHVVLDQGKYKEAESLYRESLSIYRKLDAKRGAALTLHKLARLAQQQGRRREAEKLYQESLFLLGKQLRLNRPETARVWLDYGRYSHEEEDLKRARRSYTNSLEIWHALKDQSGMAETYYELGRLACAETNLAEAEELLNKSIEIERELGDQQGIAKNLLELGEVAWMKGELAQEKSYYEQSLDISRSLDDKPAIASTLLLLVQMAREPQELDEAQRFCEESLKISQALYNKQGIANALYQSGLVAGKQGKVAKAVELFRRALTIFKELRLPIEFVEVQLSALEKMGKPETTGKKKSGGSTSRNTTTSSRRSMRAASKKPARMSAAAARKSTASSKRVARSSASGARSSSPSKRLRMKASGSRSAKGTWKKRGVKSGRAKK